MAYLGITGAKSEYFPGYKGDCAIIKTFVNVFQ